MALDFTGLKSNLRMIREMADMDIPAKVKRHAKTAYTLALMERLPPGYTPEQWALHLMDIDPDRLQDRLRQRADRELARMPEVGVKNLMDYGGSVLPNIPEMVPAELVAKMKGLDRRWTRELFENKARARLALLFPLKMGRDRAAFLDARVAVAKVFDEVRQGVGHPLSFRAKIHMKRDGEIVLMIEDLL